MKIEKLERLASLRDSGVLSEEEFLSQKNLILESEEEFSFKDSLKDNKFGLTDDNYNMAIHLSQYLSYCMPFLGLIAPLYLWIKNKDHDPEVDKHGRAVLNFNITMMIMLAAFAISIFLFIGIFLIWIPIALSLVCPVIGGLAAKEGRLWKYPLSIKFL